jgi:putative FmdB family regulatory protein
MPIYEYECEKCRRRTSVLTMRVSEQAEPVCRHCGGKSMRRLMSRFAMPRSEEARLGSLADPANFSGIDENDPKSVARMMRRMGREMGEEFSGPEFDEAIDELEHGGDLGGEPGEHGGQDSGEDGGGAGEDDL